MEGKEALQLVVFIHGVIRAGGPFGEGVFVVVPTGISRRKVATAEPEMLSRIELQTSQPDGILPPSFI